MENNRYISFGSGGTYNENVQVQGDLVQGDKNVNQELDQVIVDIQRLLQQFQNQHSLIEAQHRVATELANRARQSPKTENTLIRLGKYIAANGGIEAGIGKVVELALKLLGL